MNRMVGDFGDQTFVLTASCENGHVQQLRMEGYTREVAESYAGILDGTSPMYVYPPDRSSIIGKCGLCRAPFKATIEIAS